MIRIYDLWYFLDILILFNSTTICFSKSLQSLWFFFFASEEVIFEVKLQISSFEDIFKDENAKK